jgi:hypothetical protein
MTEGVGGHRPPVPDQRTLRRGAHLARLGTMSSASRLPELDRACAAAFYFAYGYGTRRRPRAP